ncbi:NAD(+)/NADH kinase [Streptosporangiaceae bacterium NEAU-GS5]|nr:NAD(+)/NADH kinase [Streptosporangiaceae bacterium NEAU-GS5]
MSLAPRAVLVHRRTELEELLARHGTRGQAAFFLSTRGRDLGEIDARHAAQQRALSAVSAAIPVDWRRGSVERDDLDRFLFAPDDIVVIVGQDGLVANVAKYLDGQPVIGINPDPTRNPGVLVPHPPQAAGPLLAAAVSRGVDGGVESRTMVEAVSDDRQRLLALNEIYIGHSGHQTARYSLRVAEGNSERQGSSGILVGTGTGATGWCRSAWLERASPLPLPAPAAAALCWFVREAWPSPSTGTSLTQGLLDVSGELAVTVESDGLVAFGDGIETDHLTLSWGQTITLRVASQRLRLLG